MKKRAAALAVVCMMLLAGCGSKKSSSSSSNTPGSSSASSGIGNAPGEELMSLSPDEIFEKFHKAAEDQKPAYKAFVKEYNTSNANTVSKSTQYYDKHGELIFTEYAPYEEGKKPSFISYADYDDQDRVYLRLYIRDSELNYYLVTVYNDKGDYDREVSYYSGEARSLSYEYEYDDKGRYTMQKQFDGSNVRYILYRTYNDQDKPVTETREVPADPEHNISAANYKIEYSYDENGSCISEKKTDLTGKDDFSNYEKSYEYNDEGLRTAEETLMAGGKVKNRTEFEYDSSERVIKETIYNNDEMMRYKTYEYVDLN